MRILLLLTCIIFTSHGMTQQKSMAERLGHWIDSFLNPSSYCSDERAHEVCQKILKLDPDHKNHEVFTGDKQCLVDINSAFSRQRSLLKALETAILKNKTYPKVESLDQSNSEVLSAFYSDNIKDILDSFLETVLSQTRDTVIKLENQHFPISNSELKENASKQEPPAEEKYISIPTARDIIFESHPTLIEKGINWLKKNSFDKMAYLTDQKAVNITKIVSYLNPHHPNHKDWHLNPDLEIHQRLIHQAFERECKLLNMIEKLINGMGTYNINMLKKLNPKSPENVDGMRYLKRYHSKISVAAINGYLEKVTKEMSKDLQIREQESIIRKQSLAKPIPKTSALTTALHSPQNLSSQSNSPRTFNPEEIKTNILKQSNEDSSKTPKKPLPPIPNFKTSPSLEMFHMEEDYKKDSNTDFQQQISNIASTPRIVSNEEEKH